jgi:hypothetical protein
MPEQGTRPGQQIPPPARQGRDRHPPPPPRARGRDAHAASSPGSTAHWSVSDDRARPRGDSCRNKHLDASRPVRHPLHHALRRGLRPSRLPRPRPALPSPAGPRSPSSPSPSSLPAAASCLGLPPRPPRTRASRLHPMAHQLALARGLGRHCRHALMALSPPPSPFGDPRLAPPRPRRQRPLPPHRLHHRDDLRPLKTVPRWHHWTTPALYLLYAPQPAAPPRRPGHARHLLLIIAGLAPALVWRDGDTRFARAGSTLATATGLGPGTVRSFEPPHTGPNYLLTRDGHVVGRKHATKTPRDRARPRLVPPGDAPPPAVLPRARRLRGGLAPRSALVARWLFFAEAEHVVGLYYGRVQGSSTSTQTKR